MRWNKVEAKFKVPNLQQATAWTVRLFLMKPGSQTAFIADCKIAYSSDCKIAVTDVRPLTMRPVKLFTEQSIRFQRVSAYSTNCELHKVLLCIFWQLFLRNGLCPHIDNDLQKNFKAVAIRYKNKGKPKERVKKDCVSL